MNITTIACTLQHQYFLAKDMVSGRRITPSSLSVDGDSIVSPVCQRLIISTHVEPHTLSPAFALASPLFAHIIIEVKTMTSGGASGRQ
jgi:hypothetical protein